MDKDYHHRQLVRLGDMMGDGLHKEPGGAWIAREYRNHMKALGYPVRAPRNTAKINEGMAKALESATCTKCGGKLKQSRSGSLRAACVGCGARFQFKR